MLQTINFSNEFDFKAIHDYITRIPKIKKTQKSIPKNDCLQRIRNRHRNPCQIQVY